MTTCSHSAGFPASGGLDLFDHLYVDDVFADQLGEMEGPGQSGGMPEVRRGPSEVVA